MSTILFKKGAYRDLEEYIVKTFDEFEREDLFDRNNHATRLLMRIWRINSLAKLLEIHEVHEQLPLLWKDMKMYGRQNFNEYVVYYFRAKILNDTFMGNLDEATDTLKEAFRTKELTQNPLNELYLLLSQADIHFSQEVFAKAFETIRQILSHKKFSSLDVVVQFYLHIFELVISFEAKNFGYTDTRHSQFKKKYKRMLKDDEYARAVRFVEIIMRLNQAAIEGKKVFIKSAYRHFIDDFPPSEIGDTETIMYEVYLRAKVEEKSYYEAFQEEIAKAVG